MKRVLIIFLLFISSLYFDAYISYSNNNVRLSGIPKIVSTKSLWSLAKDIRIYDRKFIDDLRTRLSRDDIHTLIRIARGDLDIDLKSLERKLDINLTPGIAKLILLALDESADMDPQVVMLSSFGMYINFRNSYAKLEHWLVNVRNYDKDGNRISDILDSILRTKTYTYSTPEQKLLLDLGDMRIPIILRKEERIVENYSDKSKILVDVVAADNNLDAAIRCFESLGGKVISVYRTIGAFSGYIELYKIPILAKCDAIGFVEKKNTNYWPMTAWTILQMRIGTNQYKYLPPNQYPYYNYTPWGMGIYGDPNMAIAIVDTGIDDTHPLTNKVIYWADYSGDGVTSPEDYHGHGTHCASIAAGNYWDEDYVEWEIIARNTTTNFNYTGSYLLNIDQSGWYGVVGLYYLSDSSKVADITLYAYDSSGNLLNTSRQIANYTNVEIEQLVFYASSPGTYNITVKNNNANTGGYLLITWEKQFPYGPYGSTPGRHAGVSPSTKLVGLKIFNRNGYFGDYNYDAIRWLIEHAKSYNITVSSNSWGGGDDATLNELMNQLVTSGVVTVVAAGNSGAGGNIGSPGSADLVITVAAINDINQVSEYSTSGDATTGNTIKPDVSANGGTGYYNGIYIDPEDSDLSGSSGAVAAADSNDADNSPRGGGILGNATTTTNNFWDIQGTSMATPHVSGLAALVISAMGGVANWGWDLASALKVKMIILMTAVEFTRAESGQTVPSLDRGGKDRVEGYGRINGDAAIMAVKNVLSVGETYSYVLGSNVDSPMMQAMAPRVWAGKIYLEAGSLYRFNLSVPSGADFDLFVYDGEPDEYGQPVIIGKSTSNYTGNNEVVDILAKKSGYYYVVVKWVDRSATNPAIPDYQNYGMFNLTISQLGSGYPLVDVVKPNNGDVVYGLYRILVNATDPDGQVVKVVLNIANSSWSESIDITSNYDNQSGYYFYDWNTTQSSDGYYNISVTVWDNDNKQNNATIKVKVWNNFPPIILVDDDTGAKYETYYEGALQDLGYQRDVGYLYWNVSINGTIPRGFIDRAVIVIWFTGDDYSTTLTSDEQNVLSYYLCRAGQLFISGQDIGFDIGWTSWYKEWLRAIYERDDTNIDNVTGVSGTIFDGAKYLLSGSDSANNNRYPSEIAPNGSSLVMYYDDNASIGAAIGYEGMYRLVYFAFPFEAINGSANRTDALGRIINWFKKPIGRIIFPSNETATNEDILNISIVARMLSGVATLQLFVNGTRITMENVEGYVARKFYNIDVSGYPIYTRLNITLLVNNSDGVYTSTVIIVRDKVAPTVSIYYPENNTYFNETSLRFSWVGSDNYELDHYEYSLDNGEWINVGLAESIVISNLSEGTHNFSVKAVDKANNTNISSLIFTIDLTPPTFIEVSITNDSILPSKFPVSWNFTDNYIIDYYGIRMDSGDWIYTSATSYTFEYIKEGDHTITIKAFDKAGNSKKVILNIIVDTTAPTLNITSPEGGAYVNTSSITVEWSMSDNYGISHCEIRIDGGPWINIGVATSFNISGLSEGTHVVDVKVVDNAGNYIVDSRVVTVDMTDPIILSMSPSDGAYVNTTTVEFTWDASDNYGINSFYVKIDDGSWRNIGLVYEYTVTMSAGYHKFFLKAVDKAGNSIVKEISIIVDVDRPTITIFSPENNSYVNTGNILVSWNYSDNYGVSAIYVRVDNGSWVLVGVSNTYIISNVGGGTHSIYVKAIDNAGNTAISVVTFTVDTTAPRITNVEPSSGSYLNTKNFIINWSATDNIGLSYSRIRIDGGDWIITNGTSYPARLDEGSHIIDIEIYDFAGNSDKVTIVVYIDTTSPTIIINQPTDRYTNLTTILVSWDAIDNFGVVFKDVSEGTHTIEILAIDYANNTNTEKITIIVDITPPKIQLLSPRNNTSVSEGVVELILNITDNFELDHIEVRIDNGGWTTLGISNTITLNLPKGKHTIYIRAIDKAGNSRTISVVLTATSPAKPQGIPIIPIIILAIIIASSIAYIIWREKRIGKEELSQELESIEREYGEAE